MGPGASLLDQPRPPAQELHILLALRRGRRRCVLGSGVFGFLVHLGQRSSTESDQPFVILHHGRSGIVIQYRGEQTDRLIDLGQGKGGEDTLGMTQDQGAHTDSCGKQMILRCQRGSSCWTYPKEPMSDGDGRVQVVQAGNDLYDDLRTGMSKSLPVRGHHVHYIFPRQQGTSDHRWTESDRQADRASPSQSKVVADTRYSRTRSVTR